jgi:hypothetical protein
MVTTYGYCLLFYQLKAKTRKHISNTLYNPILLTHNGIDIDQYLLFTIYPSVLIFGIGFLAKKGKMRESIKYTLQGLTCIIFSLAYFVAVPNGGAEGLAIVLAIFGVLLFFMARTHIVHPEGFEGQTTSPTEKM